MALINPRRMIPYVKMSFDQYAEYTGGTVMYPTSEDKKHIYIDRGGSVLAVAHLDTVLDDYRIGIANNTVYSPALDDRLGAYIILDVLPRYLDVPFDILLTTNEEKGRSTASWFETQKPYNWMFSFDRANMDVVTYQYGTDYTARLLKQVGITQHMGTYSDICNLDHLGVAGFNWGTGYKRQHTVFCQAYIPDTVKMVKKFMVFYKRFCKKYLEYVPVPTPQYPTFYRETYDANGLYYYETDGGYMDYLRWAKQQQQMGNACAYCGMPDVKLDEDRRCQYCASYP